MCGRTVTPRDVLAENYYVSKLIETGGGGPLKFFMASTAGPSRLAVAARAAQYVSRAKQLAQSAVASDASGDIAGAITDYKSSLGQIEAVFAAGSENAGVDTAQLEKFASAYRSRLANLQQQQQEQDQAMPTISAPMGDDSANEAVVTPTPAEAGHFDMDAVAHEAASDAEAASSSSRTETSLPREDAIEAMESLTERRERLELRLVALRLRLRSRSVAQERRPGRTPGYYYQWEDHYGSPPRQRTPPPLYIDGPPEMAGWYYYEPFGEDAPHMDASPDESDDATRIRGAQADEQSWQLNWDPRLHHTQDPYWQQYWHGRAARYWEQDEAEPPRPPIPPPPPPVRPRKRPLRRARNPRRCHAREPHPQARFLHGIASRHLLIDRLRLARVLSAVHGMPCSTDRRRNLPGIALSSAILPPNPMGVDLGKYQLGTENEWCADSTNRHTGPGARRAIA